MRHNRRDDGQLSCRKREMKTMNANTALDGHTTVIKMAERGGVPLRPAGGDPGLDHLQKYFFDSLCFLEWTWPF